MHGIVLKYRFWFVTTLVAAHLTVAPLFAEEATLASADDNDKVIVVNEHLEELLTEQYNQARKLFNYLRNATTGLARGISRGELLTDELRAQAAHAWLEKTFVPALEQVEVAKLPLHPQAVTWLYACTYTLSEILREAARSNFKVLSTPHLPPFPGKLIPDRSGKERVVFSEPTKGMFRAIKPVHDIAQDALNLLKEAALNVGLTWYNHFFRGVDAVISNKLVQAGVAVGALGFLLLRANRSTLLKGLYGTNKLQLTPAGEMRSDYQQLLNEYKQTHQQASDEEAKEAAFNKLLYAHGIDREYLNAPIVLTTSMLAGGAGMQQWFQPGGSRGSDLALANKMLGKSEIRFPNGAELKENPLRWDLSEKGAPSALNNLVSWLDAAAITGLAAYTAYNLTKKFAPVSTQKQMAETEAILGRAFGGIWEKAKGQRTKFNLEGGEIINDISLDDPKLIGLQSQKDKLFEIVDYMLNAKEYDRFGLPLQRAILFTGPSRSGKTLAAKALSGTINQKLEDMGMVGAVKFIEIGHFDLLQGSGRLREDLLPWLEAQAPCIVFIDEIGHMGLNAGQPTQVISWLKFLDELNQSRARIILIGATNNYTTLDRALIKHNRFGTVIRFDLPTFKERVHFFDTKIRDLALDPKSFNLKLLARRTYQAAYGDLTQVFDTAITLAKKNGEGLRQSHIEMAVDRRIRQLEEEFDTSGIAPDSIDKVAANLAGESLATLLLNPSYHRLDMIALTKIRPEYVESHDLYKMNKTRQDELRQHLASFGRVFSVDTSEEISHKTRNDLLMQCLEFTAGRAAEELLYGEGEHLWEYSIERYNMAIDSARWYLSEGRPAEWMSPEEVARYNNLATQLTAACKKLAYQLLQAHVPALKALINEIRDQRLLTADDALLVVKGKKNDAESKRILAELKKTGVQYMDLLHRGSLSAVVKNKPLSTIQEQASSAVVKALKG